MKNPHFIRLYTNHCRLLKNNSKERIFLSGADVKDVNISTDPVY